MEEKYKLSLIHSFFKTDKKTPLQKIEDIILQEKRINLYVKRDDILDRFIDGNKWFKLKYNLIEASMNGYKQLLTFGGAYSNHVSAFSYACKLFGFDGIVVIRGEEYENLNPTLKFVEGNGCKLHYLSRTKFRNKYSDELLNELKSLYGHFLLIPEGGSNHLAVKGCSEIPASFEIEFDYIFTACGTAGTLTGIATSLKSHQKAIGIAVLKNASFLNENIKQLSGNRELNFEILLDYHFGGYAKFNNQLLNFIYDFYSKHKLILEPIYTGKMLYAIYDLINKNYFPENSTIIAYHSGGLQGYKGLIKNKIVSKVYESFNWSDYEKEFNK
jgi:1-aminocyclopropane-1-carboxylate deaminase/D-cysteine desulfhydrase-like pyridoxal-dependent ACC family enzyme